VCPQLLPQRCTWLYVMNNVLMSVSGNTPLPGGAAARRLSAHHVSPTGKSSQLYGHSLAALFEQRGHLHRKHGSLSLGTSRFTERIGSRWDTVLPRGGVKVRCVH